MSQVNDARAERTSPAVLARVVDMLIAWQSPFSMPFDEATVYEHGVTGRETVEGLAALVDARIVWERDGVYQLHPWTLEPLRQHGSAACVVFWLSAWPPVWPVSPGAPS